MGVWLIRFVKELYKIQLRSDYIGSSLATWIHRLCDMTKKVTTEAVKFFCLWDGHRRTALIKIDNEFFEVSMSLIGQSLASPLPTDMKLKKHFEFSSDIFNTNKEIVGSNIPG